MRKSISEFFKPIFQNGEDISPRKWINSFLFLIGIQFVWFLIEVFNSFSLNDTFELSLAGLIILYISITCVLIVKKHKWGWILLFSEKGLTGLACLIYLVVLFSSGYYSQEEIAEYFWAVIINSLFIAYLVKNEIYTYFDIDKLQRNQYIERISIYIVAICVIGLAVFQR